MEREKKELKKTGEKERKWEDKNNSKDRKSEEEKRRTKNEQNTNAEEENGEKEAGQVKDLRVTPENFPRPSRRSPHEPLKTSVTEDFVQSVPRDALEFTLGNFDTHFPARVSKSE